MSKNLPFDPDPVPDPDIVTDWHWVGKGCYGLKVRLKSEGTKLLIDVSSSISTSNHFLQKTSCYITDFLIISKIIHSYNISSIQLLGILLIASELEVLPRSNNADIFTDSWYMMYAWWQYKLNGKISLFNSFKEKHPQCTTIELVAFDLYNRSLNVKISEDGYIENFHNLNLSGAVIELLEINDIFPI